MGEDGVDEEAGEAATAVGFEHAGVGDVGEGGAVRDDAGEGGEFTGGGEGSEVEGVGEGGGELGGGDGVAHIEASEGGVEDGGIDFGGIVSDPVRGHPVSVNNAGAVYTGERVH